MKRLRYMLLALLVSFAAIPTSANTDTRTPIDIIVNGSYIKTDAKPFIASDLTYVPVRFIGEALNAAVDWDAQNSTAVISGGGTEIVLPIGSIYGYVNGKRIKIGSGIKLMNDRTFVPVRFISESMGATVDWDGTYYAVIINKKGIDVPSRLIYEREYTNDDIYWLSRIIEAEAAGESFDGKLGVGDVVLNRVKSPDYPDSIYDVVFDREFGVQFQPKANGTIYNNPSYESVIAAKYSLEGHNAVGDSLYFLNTKTASSTWITENRTYYTTVGNHSFYL